MLLITNWAVFNRHANIWFWWSAMSFQPHLLVYKMSFKWNSRAVINVKDGRTHSEGIHDHLSDYLRNSSNWSKFYHQTKSWELCFGLRKKREERMAFHWVFTIKDDAPKQTFVWSYISPDFICKGNTDVDEWNQRHSSVYRKEKSATMLSRSGSWGKLGKNIDFLSGSSRGEIGKQVPLRHL